MGARVASTIDWGMIVDLSEPGCASRTMPLRDAIDLVLEWPVARQNHCAIVLPQAVPIRHNGRMSPRYCLNGWGIRDLAGREEPDPGWQPGPGAIRLRRRLAKRRRHRSIGLALVTLSISLVAATLSQIWRLF